MVPPGDLSCGSSSRWVRAFSRFPLYILQVRSQALCFCPQLVHFVCESFGQFLVSWSSVQCPHLGGEVHALVVCPNLWHLKHWVTRHFESYGRTSWIIEPATIPRARRVSERPSWGSFSMRDAWVFVVSGWMRLIQCIPSIRRPGMCLFSARRRGIAALSSSWVLPISLILTDTTSTA